MPGDFYPHACVELVSFLLLACALLAGGCARTQSVDSVTAKVLMTYPETAAAAPGEAPKAEPSRFQNLPKSPSAAKPSTQAPVAQVAGAEAASKIRLGGAAPSPAAPSATKPAPGGAPLAEAPKETPPGTAAVATPKPAGGLDGFVDPLTKRGDRVPVSLEACLRRALAHNLSIQIASYAPPVARTAVTEAEAIFDPSWFLNNAVGRTKQQVGGIAALFGGPTALIQKDWNFRTGLQEFLPTGANVTLSQDWTFLRANSPILASPSPQYDSNLTLAVAQPLLRGAGVEVNTAPIVLAKLNQDISDADFKIAVMDVILAVENTYWDLVVAETTVESVNEALVAAQEYLRITKRRFEEGKEKRVVVSLAESAVTTRQAELVAARLRLAQTSDLLKRIVNDPDLPLTQPAVLSATEVPMASPIPVDLTMLRQSMATALQHRPEMTQADARVSQANLRERVTKNGTLPQLDLSAMYNLNGLETEWHRSLRREFTTEFNDWAIGLDFSVPIGNRARTAAHQRSLLEAASSLTTREDVRQRVLLEVNEAIRNLASAEESIRARRAAREAAEQTLHDMQTFVSAGAALFKDLLDAQRDLAIAKVTEMTAMADYMVGLAALERAKGTLLEYNNIRVLEEGRTTTPAPATAKKQTP
jgi:outer membrane protein TolC